MSEDQITATASTNNASANESLNAVPSTSEEFSISKLFLCTWHGNLSRKPARLIDVTSAIFNANHLAPGDLIKLAQKAKVDMTDDGDANERYRSSNTKRFTFTVTTPPSSTLLATFRVPFNPWSDVPIKFTPSAKTSHQQSTFSLHRVGRDQWLTCRNHSFVHNSETFTWVFSSGMEIVLLDSRSRIRAKFHHASSWFQSGGVLEIGDDRSGQKDHKERQQHLQELEQVVVVTLLACLRREREWRYTTAGFLFPIKRTFV